MFPYSFYGCALGYLSMYRHSLRKGLVNVSILPIL